MTRAWPLGNNVTPCAFWQDASAEPPLRVAHDVPVLRQEVVSE